MNNGSCGNPGRNLLYTANGPWSERKSRSFSKERKLQTTTNSSYITHVSSGSTINMNVVELDIR